MRIPIIILATLVASATVGSGDARAQTPAADPASRLEQVLPADVAARVRAIVAKARSRDLPAEALENRALKFAAKGVKPASIETAIAEQERRMESVHDALQRARGGRPAADEVEAGAEALRKGVDGNDVSALAKSAPSGRSLAVPLYVIGSLLDRGVPADVALQRVRERLTSRATDQDLERLPSELATAVTATHGNQPAETGRALAETKRPGAAPGAGQSGGSAGGPPANVPANGGAKARPSTPPGLGNKPTTPGRKP
jgi:hypothetical protein